MRFNGRLKARELTNDAISGWINAFGQFASTLVFQIRYNGVQIRNSSSHYDYQILLSQDTTRRIRQLGFMMWLLTSDLTRGISCSSWPSLTLAMIPGLNQLCSVSVTKCLPGRSTNDRSSTPFPEMETEIQLDEKDRVNESLAKPLSGVFKNEAGSRLGFSIANWARRIRSST